MYRIVVRVSKQRLYLYDGNIFVKEYAVSTSKYGVGSKEGSNKTPLGLHTIVSKIGSNAAQGEIIASRKRTKKIMQRASGNKEDDIITTRILRLEGLEKGVNRGQGIDSYDRCIYIHGTSQEHRIGTPASHGCIRMKNHDIMELFAMVRRGTHVAIKR